ncbi:MULTISPECIES: hypothetical protein [unclassified Streptomyces]|uniref:hypothetical protein n=1 Tax=unclassified Streptomyces TaxID=2593676 RepID=UPI0036E9D614
MSGTRSAMDPVRWRILAAVLARGRGAAAFPRAFLRSTAFTVLAALVALALPAQVAAPERPS